LGRPLKWVITATYSRQLKRQRQRNGAGT